MLSAYLKNLNVFHRHGNKPYNLATEPHKYVFHHTSPASDFGLCEAYNQNSRLNMGQESSSLLLLSYEHGDRWDSFF